MSVIRTPVGYGVNPVVPTLYLLINPDSAEVEVTPDINEAALHANCKWAVQEFTFSAELALEEESDGVVESF